MIAFDTNLLVYAHREGVAQHSAARRAIERASKDDRGCGVALPAVAEFWSIVTHPANIGGPASAQEALGFLIMLTVDVGATVWMPREGFWARLMRSAADLSIKGSAIYDLQIALVAFENGASEIWTHDRNFSTVPGLHVHDPL
jgi:hypothetical protein